MIRKVFVLAAMVSAMGSSEFGWAQAKDGRSEPPFLGSDQIPSPKILHHDKQHYVGIRTTTTMMGIGPAISRLMPGLQDWMKTNHVNPVGPPFVRYLVIDMAKTLMIEVGILVPKGTKGGGRVMAGDLPAGRYATVVYTGLYSGLVGANAAIQSWARRNHVDLARHTTPKGILWDSRVEFYLTDPRREKNPAKWKTEIIYLLADKHQGK